MWRSDGQWCFDPRCGAYCKNSSFVICCPHECDAVGFLDFHPDQLLFKVTSKNKEKINSIVLIIPRIQLQTGAERLGGQTHNNGCRFMNPQETMHTTTVSPTSNTMWPLLISVWSQLSCICNFTVNRSLKTPKQIHSDCKDRHLVFLFSLVWPLLYNDTIIRTFSTNRCFYRNHVECQMPLFIDYNCKWGLRDGIRAELWSPSFSSLL